MSTYSDIVAALVALLETISKVNGYATDAGASVSKNLEYQVDKVVKPCIIVYPGTITDETESDEPCAIGSENHFLQIDIDGIIADDESCAAAEDLRLDILKAIKSDPYLGDLTQGINGAITSNVQLEEGSEGFVGFVGIKFVIFYSTTFGEG